MGTSSLLLGPGLFLAVSEFPFPESCLATTILPCQFFMSTLCTDCSPQLRNCTLCFCFSDLAWPWCSRGLFSQHNIWPSKTHLKWNKSRCWNTALPLIFPSSFATFLEHWWHFESNCFWILFREKKNGWLAFSSLFLRVFKSSALKKTKGALPPLVSRVIVLLCVYC